jgi:hypothetical protein
MKLETAIVEVETHGKMEQTGFGISDTGMLMEHMITTIYSDKVGTICREIASNARDAHREIGTPKRPIRIRFPNRFDMTYEVRDWGIGIDPERMLKVFIQLGSSTKRNDNLQTGGFGIGAKTPWCYTDVFTIRTISKEKDGVHRRREYSAVKAGQNFTLMEMGDPVVVDMHDKKVDAEDRHTGTSIIIPVPEQHNWDAFKQKTIYFTQFWDVRPELCGCDPLPAYPNLDEAYAYVGPDWKIGHNHIGQMVLVDGIPYPFNISALDIRQDSEQNLHRFVNYSRQSFLLAFGVGELSLSLNREQLQYTEETKKKIIGKLQVVLDHLKVVVEKEIANSKTYWDAHIAYQKARNNLPGAQYIGDVNWNGEAVDDKTIGMTTDSGRYPGGAIKDYTEFGSNPDGSIRIRAKDGWNLEINEHVQWVLLDEPTISRLKLAKLMEDTPDLNKIQLITPSANQTHLDAWKKDVRWDLFEPNVIKMSSLAKPEPKKRTPGQPGIKTKCYEARAGRMRDSGTLDLVNGSGVYVLVERRDCCDGLTHSDIMNAQKIIGIPTVNGIPKRFAKHIGAGWKHLKVSIAEAYAAEHAKIDLDEFNSFTASEGLAIDGVLDSRMAETLTKALKSGKIEDSTCDLADWIAESEAMEKLAAKYPDGSSDNLTMLSRLAGKAMNPTSAPVKPLGVSKANETCRKRYPLLFAVAHDWTILNNWDEMKDEIIFYVNAKNEV